MDSNSIEGGDIDEEAQTQHGPKPWEPKRERLASIHEKISKDPKLLSRDAGKTSCCIFRVPASLIKVNGRSYQPHIVSIGPYHWGNPNLEMIQEHKWRYLGSLLSRTETIGICLEDYMKAIEPLVPSARECYSEVIHLDTDELIEMMILDGCFMIELFRKNKKLALFEANDPLVTMAWIFPFFYRDFLQLENQIPYFILERLFELTKVSPKESDHSLAEIALEFFNNAMQRSDKDIANYHNIGGRHLLDLVRSSFMPQATPLPEPPRRSVPTDVIHCVSKLRRAGIKLQRAKDQRSFLVVSFQKGVLEMPTITIDDFMSSFLLNCVAYEQCHHSSSKHITTYATLLDCLVNTYKDVEYLCDRNIIENYFGTDTDVAKFINNLGKDVAFDIDRCYLAKVFDEVHLYYNNSWHVYWASFKYTYFDTPWSFISALAALILLLLTVTQTFYTVYQFYNHKE
ncbi:UPF0481 protein At3g47200 [Punica granatum]|uniref:Uncharacterized protein n=2 Tax=Punica granatum TaxID=22663 RepID=A0A218X1P0_PUNGR|nr:UPF0481 protein At3g47200 [Punica granatum]OWM79115.1 hypothetical protein CDL15_Pgr003286 [Punica granatum]PKI49238.1 hypothetical protein CRG98_030387 [Punica granatum]